MDKFYQKSYFISLILAFLPSIYLLTPIFNSLNLAKFLWFFLFIIVLVKLIKERGSLTKDKGLLFFFSLFFISQTLSIVYVLNVDAFINSYKDFVSTSILFIISLYFLKTKKDFANFFYVSLITGLINLLLQITILMNPRFFENIIGPFLHPTYLEIILVNINRGRIFLTSYNEVLIPLIFYYLIEITKDKVKMVFGVLFSILIFFISTTSGFRTNLLMYLIAFVSSLGFFKKSIRQIIIYSLLVIILLYFIPSISNTLDIDTSIDRLFQSETNIKDVTTGRSNYWGKAYEIGLSSPFFGVGLGNYYDFVDSSWKNYLTLNQNAKIQSNIALKDPHNIFIRIFAETGFFGLGAFSILIVYFIINDIKILRTKNKMYLSYALSFWVLFIFALFNPSTSLTFQTFFWTLRVIAAQIKTI